jgi:hypothetical protein
MCKNRLELDAESFFTFTAVKYIKADLERSRIILLLNILHFSLTIIDYSAILILLLNIFYILGSKSAAVI